MEAVESADLKQLRDWFFHLPEPGKASHKPGAEFGEVLWREKVTMRRITERLRELSREAKPKKRGKAEWLDRLQAHRSSGGGSR